MHRKFKESAVQDREVFCQGTGNSSSRDNVTHPDLASLMPLNAVHGIKA